MSTRMSPPKANKDGKKQSKAEKKASKKPLETQHQNEAQNQNDFQSDPDLSISLSGETLSELKKEFENQLSLIKADCNARVEALHRVVNDKDVVIGTLQKKIGELEKS